LALANKIKEYQSPRNEWIEHFFEETKNRKNNLFQKLFFYEFI